MIQKRKTLAKSTAILAAILFSISIAAAYGVTAPYWKENPLKMKAGETRDIQLLLQNMVGNEDITLRASILEGKEIATLIDKNLDYKVPFGERELKVNLKITTPPDAQLNQEYIIHLFFKQVSENEGGMLELATGVEKIIPVIIEEAQPTTPQTQQTEPQQSPETTPQTQPQKTPEFPTTSLISWIIAGAIILLIIIIIIKHKKKPKRR